MRPAEGVSSTITAAPMKVPGITIQQEHSLLLSVFYVWALILLARPQDLFPVIGVLRPVIVFGLLTLVLFALETTKSSSESPLQNPQLKLFAIFLSLMAIGVPFALHRGRSFAFVGMTLPINILFCLVFFALINSATRILRLLFVCCSGVTLYAILAVIKGISIDSRLVFGGMFDPNDLAFFVVSFLPFNFLFLSGKNPLYRRLIALGGTISGPLVVLKTGSRSGFLGLTAVIVVFLLTTRSVKPLQKILLLFAMGIAAALSVSTIDTSRFSSILHYKTDYNVTDETGRLKIWKNGLAIALDNPLTGVGVSCFEQAIGEHRQNRGSQPKWQSSHNIFVQVAAEVGFPALVIFSVMILGAFRIFRNTATADAAGDLGHIGEMAFLGFTGQFVCGLFLSQAYSICLTFYIVLSAVLFKLLNPQHAIQNKPFPHRSYITRRPPAGLLR